MNLASDDPCIDRFCIDSRGSPLVSEAYESLAWPQEDRLPLNRFKLYQLVYEQRVPYLQVVALDCEITETELSHANTG
ncbi:MAG TPA: hypothetical protein PKK06_18385 [Phycisphaerae bacterium]|nr:hypothetical protein [Phycisphaerae bacterium]